MPPLISILPFEPADLVEAGGELDRGTLLASYPAKTLRVDGAVIGCAGIVIPYDGFGEAWSRPTELVKRFPKLYLSSVRWQLYAWAREFDLVRVQMTVIEARDDLHRWAKALGMVKDATLQHYGPNDQAVTLYTMFPKESPWVSKQLLS